MLLLIQIYALLRLHFYQNLAAQIHDPLDKVALTHRIELLREGGRRDLRRRVVAAVALSLEKGRALDEAQLALANLAKHVRLFRIVELQ